MPRLPSVTTGDSSARDMGFIGKILTRTSASKDCSRVSRREKASYPSPGGCANGIHTPPRRLPDAEGNAADASLERILTGSERSSVDADCWSTISKGQIKHVRFLIIFPGQIGRLLQDFYGFHMTVLLAEGRLVKYAVITKPSSGLTSLYAMTRCFSVKGVLGK